jgi:hypothetical protein
MLKGGCCERSVVATFVQEGTPVNGMLKVQGQEHRGASTIVESMDKVPEREEEEQQSLREK